MKIAVIGSGISGLSSAYYLSKKFKVDLFEQEDYFGGHSYTYDIKSENKTISVRRLGSAKTETFKVDEILKILCKESLVPNIKKQS